MTDEPFTVQNVLEALREPEDWIAHGWVNLLLSSVVAFPHQRDVLLGALSRTASGGGRRRLRLRR